MKSSCSVEGCGAAYKGLGYCNRHYQHFKKYGDPVASRRSAQERFWEKVGRRDDDECWPWLAHRNAAGYGRFGTGHASTALASRWILGELRGSPLRWDAEVQEVACHTCDNPPCVNPAHLYVGTYSGNNQDAHDRGRGYTPRSKTHCRNGHEYSPENTYLRSGGTERQCKTCALDHQRRYRAKQAALRAS